MLGTRAGTAFVMSVRAMRAYGTISHRAAAGAGRSSIAAALGRHHYPTVFPSASASVVGTWSPFMPRSYGTKSKGKAGASTRPAPSAPTGTHTKAASGQPARSVVPVGAAAEDEGSGYGDSEYEYEVREYEASELPEGEDFGEFFGMTQLKQVVEANLKGEPLPWNLTLAPEELTMLHSMVNRKFKASGNEETDMALLVHGLQVVHRVENAYRLANGMTEAAAPFQHDSGEGERVVEDSDDGSLDERLGLSEPGDKQGGLRDEYPPLSEGAGPGIEVSTYEYTDDEAYARRRARVKARAKEAKETKNEQ